MSIAVPLTTTEASAADAAALLYERHATRILAFCRRRLRSREEAEDAVQQTFLKAFAAMRGGFRPTVERAWLYRIAENVCADRQRASMRRGRHESGDVSALSEVLPAREAPPPLEGLDQALLELTPSQRQALLLREWQGMSYQEIAAELRLSQSAVETLLFRARRSLARRLEDQRAALRSWAGEAIGLAGWLKSAFAGGTAVKAALAVVAAGTVGAAAVAPLVADERRPFAPAPALSTEREPSAPAADRAPAPRPLTDHEARGRTAGRAGAPPADTRAYSPPPADAAASPEGAPPTAPATKPAAPPESQAPVTRALEPPPPTVAPLETEPVQLPEAELPITTPTAPELPIVPELPTPPLELPSVSVPAPVDEVAAELPKLP